MSKKNQPYSEIIDLQKELKEYRKLCRGKSKEFTYYLDWKQYMVKQIQKLKEPDKKDKIINFKHFLINANRVNKNINQVFITIMIFIGTIMFTKTNLKIDFPLLLLLLIAIMLFLLLGHDKNNKEYCFYCDLIEIVKEIENEEG